MRIKELRESRNVQQKELASALGISPNTLSQYENEKREPNKKTLSQIAEYFDASTDFVYGITDVVNCEECGLSYNPLIELDVEVHNNYHRRWKKAVLKYEWLYSNTAENEKVKSENRNKVKNKMLSLEERIEAQIIVYKCMFSRSLSACNYSDKHVDFNTYVSMMLYNEECKSDMGSDVYEYLVAQYGTAEGIPSGKSYFIERNCTSNDASLQKFTTYYSKLNRINQEKVEGYIESLYNAQKYEDQLPMAAHERTDIEVTDDMIKHDNDIMDDENF